ncbi:MAG: ferredoxin [Candidatus Bathyarchaeota archaeon]|nr:ferredoxin [Candidatus Bathyarchaeota archaeon]
MVEYKIEIERTLCIACGSCYSSDPVHFEPDQTTKSTVVGGIADENSSAGTFNDEEIEAAKEAQDSCPASAIIVTEQ